MQIPSVVPWAEYEALRQQHAEGIQALREMAGILQSLVPHGTIPAALRKFIPEIVPSHRARQEVPENDSYRDASPETHVQPVQTRNNQPRSPLREDHSQTSPLRENYGGTDRRKTERRSPQRGRYSETVASTPMERGREAKPITKQNDGPEDNPTAFSAREAADMKKMIERVLQQNKLLPTSEEQSRGKLPFVAEVMEKPLPRKFKMPQINPYSGKDDPYDHVQNYESLMMLHGWDDEIMCRAFPLTLTGHARAWFNGLPEASISSFGQLKTEFIKAFIINSQRKKDATYLLSIRQGNKETLRHYVDRFRNATLEICNLPIEMAVSAMFQGTRLTPLQESLSLDPPKSLADLFVRANRYILHAEMMKTIGGSEDGERNRKERDIEEGSNQRKERTRRSDTVGPQFHHYTRLNQPRSTILATVEGSGLLQLPKKADRPMGRNQEEYCRYHRTRGHSTDQCRELKNQIEALIREGHLQRYVRTEGRNDRDRQRREEMPEGQDRRNLRQNEGIRDDRMVAPPDNEPTHQAIHVISGGETLAGSTSSSRKAYARQAYQVNSVMEVREDEEPITFTPADRGDIILPHDDPMVISAVIAKHPISRILVDSGSSVNLIYWNCFEQMNISQDRLRKVSSPLYSFTGEPVSVAGSVQLPVTLGADPQSVTRQANFMVVKAPSAAYNMILGRPLLNDMRAVVSSCYLLMKFPTLSGVGQVRGDQRKARSCYVSSTKGKKAEETLSIAEKAIHKSLEEETARKPQPVEKLEAVRLSDTDPEKLVYVGMKLPKPVKDEIMGCLRENLDVFAWTPRDMPGISPDVICHHLNVDPQFKPV
ncbi:uncharacterized protein LOC127802273 [Diospyros lotus]|uniref:uncharacterized protein LOC127802273 n=1 Tax=Diospyros lotus TaxID=55363 RepID=UPI0022533ED9|nr:uncharacterized protein LOC127802273 [Diospyros lotus]